MEPCSLILVPVRVPGLVSLLFWHTVPSSRPGSGSPLLWNHVPSYHFLVLVRVPGLVSLLFWNPVPSSFPGSGWGSEACLPTHHFLVLVRVPGLVSLLIISWFRLGLPTLLASCSIIISWFRLGFRGLFPYSFGFLFPHHFLVRGLSSYTVLALCSIIISWFRLGFRGWSPVLASCSCKITSPKLSCLYSCMVRSNCVAALAQKGVLA